MPPAPRKLLDLLVLLALLLSFAACRKHAGDECKLEEGDRACGAGLYCEGSPSLLGLFNEHGVCRAYQPEGAACGPSERCASGLVCDRDAACRRLVVAKHAVPDTPFDARGWASNDPTLRIGMARSLRAGAQTSCAGKTSRDLDALLGAPDRTAPTTRSWHLGLRESGASMMFPYDEYLVAEIEDAGACTRLFITNDD